MDWIANKFVLLTGAGFSKPFGGFLSSEFNDRIRYALQKTRTESLIKRFYGDQFGEPFEKIYEDVIAIGDTGDTKILGECLDQVFNSMDDSFSRCLTNDSGDRLLHEKLFCRFRSEDPKRPGFVFTLNHDLLFERVATPRQSDLCPSYPHLSKLRHFDPLCPFDVSLANGPDPSTICELNYVKLHGSVNWYHQFGSERVRAIGGNKDEQIRDRQLLTWYQEIFRQALATKGCKLLVIGYSFGDDHINKAIRDAMKNNDNMTLFTVSPEPSNDLKGKLDKKVLSEKSKCRWIHLQKSGRDWLGCQEIEQYYFNN